MMLFPDVSLQGEMCCAQILHTATTTKITAGEKKIHSTVTFCILCVFRGVTVFAQTNKDAYGKSTSPVFCV